MRSTIILVVILLAAAGCSEKVISPVMKGDRETRSDNRYDYILSEALRQKYVGELSEAASLFEKCIELDKYRSVPYYELAQMYSAAGMRNKSLEYASTAARLEPGNYWYQLACGSLFTQYEMKDSALVYFLRAIKADTTAVEVKGILAGIYSERGETAKADSLFKILEEDGVLTPDMSLMMIYDLISMNKVDEAAERAIKLLELNPEETRYRALLADIYYENGLKEKSDSIYAAIIEEDPDNIESQFLYLMNLVNRKEYTGISGFLRNIFRSEVVEREGKIAVARRMAGDSAYMKENAESMIESLLLLEEQYPDDEEVISLRPAIYEATDKIDLAIQRYEEIIKSIRQGFWFKERLMILYARKNEYSKLYELAGDYSRDNNRSLIGKIYYALAAMELGEYSVAGNELKKAMILAGNNNELKVQVLSLEGDLHYRKKDFDASYACYEEALKLSPDDPLLLNNYAYFLAEGDKDLKKALKMIMKVIETESGNATYVDTYAWVLYKMGKYRDAHREMVRVFELSSDRDPELLEHMGFIKKAVGRCEEAVVYWKEALKEDSKKAYLEEEIIKCQKQ